MSLLPLWAVTAGLLFVIGCGDGSDGKDTEGGADAANPDASEDGATPSDPDAELPDPELDAAQGDSAAPDAAGDAGLPDASDMDSGDPGPATPDAAGSDADATAPDAAGGDGAGPDGGLCPDLQLQIDGTCVALEGACAQANAGCTQRCEPAGAGAVCSCFPGFKLASDAKSCVPFMWSVPSAIDTLDTTGSTAATAPGLRARSDGNLLSLWGANGASSTPGLRAARTPDGPAMRWPERTDVLMAADARIRVASLPGGGDLAVMQSGSEPWSTVASAEGTWNPFQSLQIAAEHMPLEPNSALAVNPSSGHAALVWSASQSGKLHVWLSRYAPDSGWGAQVLVSQDLGFSGSEPQVALDAQNTAIIAWQQDDGARLRVHARRQHADGGFVEEHVVEPATQETRRPLVAVDSANNVFLAYQRLEDGKRSLWVERRDSSGNWEPALRLAAAADGTEPTPLRLVAGARGTAFLFFAQDGIVTTRFRPFLGWSAPNTISEIEAFSGLQVAMDEMGNVVALWQAPAEVVINVITYTRYVAGTGWFRPTRLPNSSALSLPSLALLPDGRAFAAWVHRRFTMTGETMSLMLSRLQ